MAPPELAADAPVLDVRHPVTVGVDPVGGDEIDLARPALDTFDQRQAARAEVVHLHEPLVGQVRLDCLAAAVAARHLQLVRFGFHEQARGFEVGKHELARLVAVEAVVLRRNGADCTSAPDSGFHCFSRVGCDRAVINRFGITDDLCFRCKNIDQRQLVAQPDLVVVEIVRRRDLDHAGTELAVDIIVGDHRDQPAGQRQGDGLADQVRVTLVVGMHHHRGVAEHRFRPCRGDHQRAAAVAERIADRPQKAVLFLVDHFQVGDRGLQHRVPVDEALATVDQALLVQAHERLDHRFGGHRVHREYAAGPVSRGAEAAHLALDRVAGVLLPLPHLLDETFAPQRVARVAVAFLREIARHHHFGGDAGVVAAHLPQGVVAAHAVVADQCVLQRVLERVAHVQGAGDVGRRQQDRKSLSFLAFARWLADSARLEHAAALPLLVQAGLELGRVVAGGERGHGRDLLALLLIVIAAKAGSVLLRRSRTSSVLLWCRHPGERWDPF